MSAFPSSPRAGRYIQQPAGYRAFIAAALPPDPPVQWTGELRRLLSDADRALGRLDGSIQTLPNPDLFVFMYVRKEAVLSSQIEGTQSSLVNVLEAEAKVFAPDAPKDVDEVLNYVKAMNFGLEQLDTLPLSLRLIRQIHERLLSGVRGERMQPGELRRSQNWLGPSGATLHEASFVPPPPDVVPQALSDWERFVALEDEIPLLAKIGLAHAQFETIHPFLDGNGRVGRLLITFHLCAQHALSKPVLYLSYYFRQHRQEYYDRLQAVRDKGDWEGWLTFFLRGVAQVAEQATKTSRDIVAMREEHRALITRYFGRAAAKGLLVLESLFARPILGVKEVMELTEASFQSANELIKRLVERGLLTEITGQVRNRRFRYAPYIRIFADNV